MTQKSSLQCAHYHFIVTFVIFLLSKTTAGMLCRQEELGVKITINCTSKIAPYCCVLNGRMSCCSDDQYNAEKNGPGMFITISMAVFVALLVLGVATWCWFNHKKRFKKTIQNNEKNNNVNILRF